MNAYNGAAVRFVTKIALWALLPAYLNAAPLELDGENPHYAKFRGKPVLLTGSGEHYGAVLNLDFNYKKYLASIEADGLNLTRTFTGAYVEPANAFNIQHNTLAPAAGRLICPWARSLEAGYRVGGHKFDLDRFDPEYFRRLKDFMTEANQRGVVVELDMFSPMYEDVMWVCSPLHAANNVNGIDAVGKDEVFVLGKDQRLLAVQVAMVRKIVEELNEFDNLYYEICNEPYFAGVTREWHDYVTEVIVDTEKPLPKKHLISWNVANDTAKIDKPHPAISIFNFHYAQTSAATDNLALNKLIGLNETGFKGTADEYYRRQAWEFVMSGGGLYNHLDYSFTVGHEDGSYAVKEPTPGGGGPNIRKQFRVMREFIEGFAFVRMAPHNELLKSGLAAGSKAFVLAEPGRQYAVYISKAEAAKLQLDLPPGRYEGAWIDVLTGETTPVAFELKDGRAAVAAPLTSGDAALRLISK